MSTLRWSIQINMTTTKYYTKVHLKTKKQNLQNNHKIPLALQIYFDTSQLYEDYNLDRGVSTLA